MTQSPLNSVTVLHVRQKQLMALSLDDIMRVRLNDV